MNQRRQERATARALFRAAIGLAVALFGCSGRTLCREARIQHLNPQGLHDNPAFSQVVFSEGSVRTVVVGGQNAMDQSGEIVGRGDLGAQTEQAFRNLEVALAAAGASLEHIVKWNVYIVQGQPLEEGFAVFQRVWADRPNPPTITMLFVADLANPEFLVEIDAIAMIPMP